MKDFKNKYFEKYFAIVKIIELPCLNFSTYEAVRVLEDSISLRDANLHHSALEKLAEIIKGADNRDYYFSELIKLAIESKSESILKSTMITFGEKLDSYYISQIIKHTMELGDDNKLLELVWDKFANQIDDYHARQLMEELIDAKNTELLNLITDKLIDIIKSGTIGYYHLEKLFEKAIEINEHQIFDILWDKFANQIDDYHAIKLMEELIDAKNTELLNLITDKLIDIIKSGTIGSYYLEKLFEKAIEINEPQIFDILWGKFSEKIEKPSDVLINAAIKSKNMQFFHIIWDKFSDKIPNLHKNSVIDVALKSENEFKIDTVVKKYIAGYYNKLESKFLIQNLLKSKQDVISKEIKILFSKLLLKVKTVDFESLQYFYQNDALYEKDENGFPLAYYLSQKEVDIPARKLLDSLDINKYLPEGSSIFSRSSSYKYYVNKEASKSIMIVTGEDHNGAFNDDRMNKYLNKGFNITMIDHRNEKDVCLKNYLFDYYSYLQEQSIDLYYSDLLILNMHGGIRGKSGKHTITRDGMGARTFEYLKDLTEKFADKPVKVLLTACFGQAALLDSIEILPNGSEMLTISEYRKVGDKTKTLNNGREIETSYAANLSQRTDLSAGDVLKLENIAYLYIEGYPSNKPSPAYAKKDKDGNIKMFSCIEKLEDLIEGKIDLSNVKKLQQSFVLKYCGNEDVECINKSSSVIEKTLDSIKYMHMLNLGYKYHAEEVNEKLLDRSEYSHSFDYFNVKLALGCQIGFSEINGDFEE